MQFLNDKFFRVAVILFFFLMALPFMFSEPQTEKKDNTPALEFEDKNPVYNIINRIAKFYGLKKENNKDNFTLNNEQISQIKKQITEKKEKQLEQSIKEKLTEKPGQNTATAASGQNAPAKETAENKPNTNVYQRTNTYVKLNNEIYEVLKDKDNKTYFLNKKNFIAMDSLPKAVRKNLKPYSLPDSQKSAQKRQDIKTAVYNNENALKTQKGISANQNNQSALTLFNTTAKTSAKNGSVSSFFKPTTKAGQDFIDNIDSSIKNMKFIKQNKGEQNQTKEGGSYTRTYKAQIFNPNTKKTQEVSVQQQITPDNIKTAEQVRKITAENISQQGYNESFFTYHGKEISFPQAEYIANLPPQVPPHIIISELAASENLTTSFDTAKAKAEQKLPNTPDKFPALQFVYKNNRNRIIRAPNDSFNVQAISRLLANRVLLPENTDIDFLDTKGCIYVVPEKQLYEQYTSMNIPVIYYPELSPGNLDKAYNTAQGAIDTLMSNKERQLQNEQSQNKSEIENILTSKE